MREATSNGGLSFQEIPPKTFNACKRLVCGFMALMFLGAYGCKFSDEAKPETTNSSQKNEKLTNEEPTDAGFSSPVPTQEASPTVSLLKQETTPIPDQTMTEEEMNNWAQGFLKRLSGNMPIKDSPFSYNKDNEQQAIATIKMYLGDFSHLKEIAEKLVDHDLIENRKEMFYYEMDDFGSSCSNQMSALAFEIMDGRSGVRIENLNIYTGYPDSFSGKDTIRVFEAMILELYGTLSQQGGENFENKANEILGFIYNVYFNLSNENVTFNQMHPLIKLDFVYMAMSVLSTIYNKAIFEGVNLEVGANQKFEPLQLSAELQKNLIYGEQLSIEILDLMDAYIYGVKTGE